MDQDSKQPEPMSEPVEAELSDEQLAAVAGGRYAGTHVLYHDIFIPA